MPVPVAVQEFLSQSGQPFESFSHPRAYTAQEEAAVTHVPGREWAKTVVCLVDDEPVLVVLGADRIVDIDRFREFTGCRQARLATEQEFARWYPDCEMGAMPPLGPLYKQRVFVDRMLTRSPEIVFNAGTHVDSVRMPYGAFADLVKPVVGEFTLHA